MAANSGVVREGMSGGAVAAPGRDWARGTRVGAYVAAGGPTDGELRSPYSVPGRVAHAVAIEPGQHRDLGDDHQWQQVIGQVIPFDGTFGGLQYRVVVVHGDTFSG